MSLMARGLLTHASSFRSPPYSQQPLLLPNLPLSTNFSAKPLSNATHGNLHFPFVILGNRTRKVRSVHSLDDGISEASTSRDIQDGSGNGAENLHGSQRLETSQPGTSFLAKLAIALGVAATVTLICVYLKWPTQGSTLGLPVLSHASSASTAHSGGFTLKAFGYQVILPEYAPGWIYFWLLMAAGCGLFVSEEALNIWVGISLARLLTLDGTWASFAESFSRNASYIISTVLWVYWGVCISDMVPFYIGKLVRQTGASDDICSKLGIDKEKAANVTRAVQKYGNLIGFVERFSIGMRNPTAFVAGSLGISPEFFFGGVCCGCLITLPVQLTIGFFLRERPVVALASVATIVGIWTVFPYAVAAATALFLFLRQRYFN